MGRLLTMWVMMAACVGLCAALLVCLEAPASQPAHWLAQVLPVPDVWTSDYERALAASSAETSPAQTQTDLRAAQESASKALQAAPLQPDNWLRLALARARLNNQLTSGALLAFARSYEVAPVDPTVGVWRVHFGLEAWNSLSPPLRHTVLDELDALWGASPDGRAKLTAAVNAVTNPAGRSAGSVEIQHLSQARS